MNTTATLDGLPGFRRRFRITPGTGWVRAEVEDDFHHMLVTLRHAGGRLLAVEPQLLRAPWSTCPGAEAQLRRTFSDLPLEAVVSRGEKSQNCTHLHDLAVLAATHAADRDVLVYDILVSDPVAGRREAEVRRNGEPLLSWVEREHRISEPAALAGLRLDELRPWIESLDGERQEAARLLRWGAILAHGRTIPMARQSDASRMPPNCFTFQPERARQAYRVGQSQDFSRGPAQPLGPSVQPDRDAHPTSRPSP